MRKLLKWLTLSLLTIALIIVAAIVVFQSKGKRILSKTYSIEISEFDPGTDSNMLARGSYLASALCSHCHGHDLGGTSFFHDETMGFLPASNLTSGKGGIGAVYSNSDWVRAIRHGVGPDGRGLRIMPSQAFNKLDSIDMISLITYLKSLPPIDKEFAPASFTFLSRTLIGAGMFGDFVPAAMINHDEPYRNSVDRSDGLAYGRYLYDVSDCVACHKTNLQGGKSPEPGAPPIPAIDKSSPSGSWSAEQFIHTMKTGLTPDGRRLDDKFMPWTAYAHFTEMDLRLIHTYIRSIE